MVTALDVSKTALERLKSDADLEGLFVETMESSWWHADIDRLGLRKSFDLVLVTSSPAVKDPESFDRMMQCSRKFCFYSFHIRREAYSRVDHEEIFRNVLKREPKRSVYGKGSFFINGFMYVYLLGYRPVIRIMKHDEKRVVQATEAAEKEIQAIERFDACTEEEKRKVREYYRRAAPDGKYQIRPESYTGMMAWSISPDERNMQRNKAWL
jgi:hypothetical protein